MIKGWRALNRGVARLGTSPWIGLIPLLLVWVALTGCETPPVVDSAKMYNDAYLSLRQAAVDPDAHVRAKAMEAFSNVLGSACGPILMEGLRDPIGPVRFSAAMGVGDTRYAAAHPLLVAMAKDPQTPAKLQCALIYALHRLGDDTYTGQLGYLLYDKDKWIRCTAAMVLGRMGEPSAIEPLKGLRWEDHDPIVQLQAYEALAELGDERSISLLEAFTKSQFLEDRIIAIQTLGRIGNQRSVASLKNLLEDKKQDPTVRVAAAGALAKMHDKSGMKLAVACLTEPAKMLRESRPKNAAVPQQDVVNLQSMAALALGNMDDRDVVGCLAPLIHAPNGTVRVAVDEAVMQLLASFQLSLPAIEPERLSASAMPTTEPGGPSEETPAPTTQPAAPAETAPEKPTTEVTSAPVPEAVPTPATEPAPTPTAAPATAPAPEATPAPTSAPVPAPAVPAQPAPAPEQPAATPAPSPTPPAASQPASQPSEQQNLENLLKNKPPPRLKSAGARD